MAAPGTRRPAKCWRFTGGLTRTLAIIAVIACGIAISRKLSWDWAIKIIVGIVLIFGAAAIVDYVIAASSQSWNKARRTFIRTRCSSALTRPQPCGAFPISRSSSNSWRQR